MTYQTGPMTDRPLSFPAPPTQEELGARLEQEREQQRHYAALARQDMETRQYLAAARAALASEIQNIAELLVLPDGYPQTPDELERWQGQLGALSVLTTSWKDLGGHF